MKLFTSWRHLTLKIEISALFYIFSLYINTLLCLLDLSLLSQIIHCHSRSWFLHNRLYVYLCFLLLIILWTTPKLKLFNYRIWTIIITRQATTVLIGLAWLAENSWSSWDLSARCTCNLELINAPCGIQTNKLISRIQLTFKD